MSWPLRGRNGNLFLLIALIVCILITIVNYNVLRELPSDSTSWTRSSVQGKWIFAAWFHGSLVATCCVVFFGQHLFWIVQRNSSLTLVCPCEWDKLRTFPFICNLPTENRFFSVGYDCSNLRINDWKLYWKNNFLNCVLTNGCTANFCINILS